ncbi:carbon-nitrogen hydrolase family protein [Stenotrophobium rhamnosiphilum]|uniref:Amidohydrolase n=1 Tax=Stenotrophobium rhamnosiphilum TaxID=2029166 RepID=A0A2T5MEU6_9GAMM|nr:carbon-nitrogen hydrolase family protein [Stenotrophobium rhamnosiphilum]PTU31105.1 amidohydrolase [Stenotrophobium rhamnosiphilum]
MSSIRLASAQFPVSEPQNWNVYADQIRAWVADAAKNGAQLLLFPEYAAMSLAALFDTETRADLNKQVQAMQSLRDDYLALHVALAQQYGVYIVAGSFPWQCEDGRVVNRAWFCAPDGRSSYQDKQIMTRFERESWNVTSGDGLRIFRTKLGVIAINICYDCEFPLLARAQCEAGAQLLLVPSCTDTNAGYHRVRVGAQARALENQCVVLQSPLVGTAPWSAAVDINVGSAALYGPPDYGFPDDGVIAQGTMNQAQWIYADIDLDQIERVRQSGQVLNYEHWFEQNACGIAMPKVDIIDL